MKHTIEELEQQARTLSDAFLKEETQYRLGFVAAEQPNPLTVTLGETYRADTRAGVSMLCDADAALIPVFRAAVTGKDFDDFARDVCETLTRGGKIFLSGCGSTGRLAMRLEASWRLATQGTPRQEQVISLMTGGDYALIRAVESFEDSTELGEKQALLAGVRAGDLLIGVTATGETTSILGTAQAALGQGARVWMIVCTDPATLKGKLERADRVYDHPACRSLYLPCGGMAVTGSTRMQSSSIEQAVIGAALEEALTGRHDRAAWAEGFAASCRAVRDMQEKLTLVTDAEAALYQRGGHVTYFASDYLLDVLADTTERAPTFCVPPFRPQKNTDETLSWAFVKNPLVPTPEAWRSCFAREVRCLETSQYAFLGLANMTRPIGKNELFAYEIGCEADPERENGDSMALWIGENAPAEFLAAAQKYRAHTELDFSFSVPDTRLCLWEHLAAKMALNTFSTGVMAKCGRIRGHYMVSMSISNKKLVDRATRMIADLCGLSYEQANCELFYSRLMCGDASPVQATIERLMK